MMLIPQTETFVRNAIGLTRQAMIERQVSGEFWYRAFDQEEERQRMRDTGHRLFGLAIQYLARARNKEEILQKGRRIGELYGEQCGRHNISLTDTVRAFFFFRDSLLQATRPGLVTPRQYDAEDVRIHRQLCYFLDEVLFACLARYEAICRKMLQASNGPQGAILSPATCAGAKEAERSNANHPGRTEPQDCPGRGQGTSSSL